MGEAEGGRWEMLEYKTLGVLHLSVHLWPRYGNKQPLPSRKKLESFLVTKKHKLRLKTVGFFVAKKYLRKTTMFTE